MKRTLSRGVIAKNVLSQRDREQRDDGHDDTPSGAQEDRPEQHPDPGDRASRAGAGRRSCVCTRPPFAPALPPLHGSDHMFQALFQSMWANFSGCPSMYLSRLWKRLGLRRGGLRVAGVL